MGTDVTRFINCLCRAAGFAAVMATPSLANAQAIVTGSGVSGVVTQSLATSGPAALLASFDVNYGFGNDHKLRGVTILPTESRRTVGVGFYDKNGDDRFSYRAGFYPLTQQVYTNEVTGKCAGQCSTPVQVPPGQTFILRGFETTYYSGDHNIQTLGVEHGGGALKIYMKDKNGDDSFFYRIRYAIVPNNLIASSSQSSGNGAYAAQTSILPGKTVIRGFMFHFGNGDHHIGRIQVAPERGTLKVSYTDKNRDDPFSWRVQWANLAI